MLPVRSESLIRLAVPSDHPTLALTLAAAFDDDPVSRFCFRTDSHRHSAMQAGFRRALELYHPFRLTFTVNDGEGVALWARHDQWKLSFLQECSLIPLYVRICGANRFMRLVRGFNAMESNHPSEAHYYLCMLGVHL